MGISDWFSRSKSTKVKAVATKTPPGTTLPGRSKKAHWYITALAQTRNRQQTLLEIRAEYDDISAKKSLLLIGKALDHLTTLIDAAPNEYENPELSTLIEVELRLWAMLQKQFEHRDKTNVELEAAKYLEMSAKTLHAAEQDLAVTSASIRGLIDELKELLATEVKILQKVKRRPLPSSKQA